MNEAAGPGRVPLHRDASWPGDIDRSELLDLHRMFVDEYRFQVKLNSDRTQIYLVLNAAIITAATGLLKSGDPATTRVFVAAIFLVGFFVARIAARATRRGHAYYRAVVYKKTIIENLLGRHRHIEGHAYPGATLAIETTVGMASEKEILDDAEKWLSREERPGTIAGGLIRVFTIFAVVDALAALYIVAIAIAESSTAWW